MNIAILFINVGYYHHARLAAAFDACAGRGWRVVGVQVTDNTLRHPWGSLTGEHRVPIITMRTQTGSFVTPEGEIPAVSADRVNEVLVQLEPDVLFIPGWSFEICRQCLTWCRKQSVPAVLMSESKKDDEPRSWFKEQLKKFMYVRHFEAALVSGAIHADYASFLGVPRSKIFTGYGVVDNAYFEAGADGARRMPTETRAMFPGIPTRPYFIAASRLVERKNILGLIRAYRGYLDHEKDERGAWDLVICGNGPQLDAVKHEVSSCHLDNRVHLPGFVTYSEMPAWYGMAGAFVHPALQEQWGLVVNEACAAGLPVVVGNTVGASYDLVVDGENGFLIEPANPGDIAEKLALIARCTADTLRKMGNHSRQLVGKLSPERFGAGVVSAVLAAKRGA